MRVGRQKLSRNIEIDDATSVGKERVKEAASAKSVVLGMLERDEQGIY